MPGSHVKREGKQDKRILLNGREKDGGSHLFKEEF
jgi:hypothetical protein